MKPSQEASTPRPTRSRGRSTPRAATLRLPVERGLAVADAILRTAEHPALVPRVGCPEPDCTLEVGHAGDHDLIPF